eukprot:TRINITY_DN5150_c0_g1_i16.p1 TRINITY_DN5150_c0_g1~~TRINITY_DN5150_c0_g1_i16.p1  ORF type:complete len:170 (+),score=6.98 TRINITY_DN5150_c0_g1_i16:36-545(+)
MDPFNTNQNINCLIIFHLLQESPILHSIIIKEISFFQTLEWQESWYLNVTSDCLWLKNTVRVLDKLHLLPNISKNFSLWPMELTEDVKTMINLKTGEIYILRDSVNSQCILKPKYLRVNPSLVGHFNLEIIIPTSFKIPISSIYNSHIFDMCKYWPPLTINEESHVEIK